MKYLIITKPKAGTHLCASLFEHLGLNNSYMHLNIDNYQKYLPENLAEAKTNPKKFTHNVCVDESFKLIPDGHFAYTHLLYCERTKKIFENFCKVLIVRDNAEIRESYKTWQQESGRTAPLVSEAELNNIEAWKLDPEVFVMEFNDLIDRNIDKVDQLQEYLFGSVITNSENAISQALKANTLTKSSKRE